MSKPLAKILSKLKRPSSKKEESLVPSNSIFTKPLSDIYVIASVNRPLSRKLFVLYAIAVLPEPTGDEISLGTGIPLPTVHRLIRGLRDDGVGVTFKRKSRADHQNLSIGKTGGYVIKSWGNIDEKEFLSTFEEASINFRKP